MEWVYGLLLFVVGLSGGAFLGYMSAKENIRKQVEKDLEPLVHAFEDFAGKTKADLRKIRCSREE